MDKMLLKYVVPGSKIELQTVRYVKSETEEGVKTEEIERKVYGSKIYDVISDDRLEILMPMEQSRLILLPIDAEYDMYIFTENGLYQCEARVVDRYKDNNVYVLVMDLISNLRKRQRREFYRFSCALEMNSRELLEEEVSSLDTRVDQLQPGLPLKRSIIVDISGGGLRFVSDHAYNEGSLILCKYALLSDKGLKEYNLKGKVLQVQPVPNRQGVYEHRVQYVNMDLDEREEIIRYIFNEDRKHRRKERGL